MRGDVGIVAVHVALMAAGFGVLQLTGQLHDPSPARLVFAGGLAYLAGVASVFTVMVTLLVIGMGVSLVLFAVVCLVLAAPALLAVGRRKTWAGRFRRPTVERVRATRPETWATGAILAALAWIGVIGARAVAYAPLTEYDNWLIWTRKAVLLSSHPRFPDLFLSTRVESGGHWDYPILLPLLQAMQFRGAGVVVPERAHLAAWIILFMAIWAAGYLVRRTTRPIVWAAVGGGVVLLELSQVATGLADTPMACFLGLGALAVGLWVDEGRTSDLAIGAVLLAGAAGVKTEGIMGALIVLGVAFVIALLRRRRENVVAVVAAGAAVGLLAIVPWQLWIATHGIPATTSISQAFGPGYLVDHVDRVWPSVKAIYGVLSGLNLVQLVLPAAIALIIVRWRSLRPVAAFYLAVGVLYFLALVWAYWTTPLDLNFLIGTSASRIHVGVVMLAMAAILHLGGERVPAEEPAAAVDDGPPEAEPRPIAKATA